MGTVGKKSPRVEVADRIHARGMGGARCCCVKAPIVLLSLSLMLPLPCCPGESDNRNQQKMEMKVWDPDNPLTDRQIDQFLVVAR